MKKLARFFAISLMISFITGCSQQTDLSAIDPKWDRDVCERCKMLLSDKKFSAEIINPTNGKHYFFDDLGCALNWITEKQNHSWASRATIFANDAKTGDWLDVSKNVLALGYVTPMSYGIAVFKDKNQIDASKKIISLTEAFDHVKKIKKLKEHTKSHTKH